MFAKPLIYCAAVWLLLSGCVAAPTAPPIEQSAISGYREVVETLRVEASAALSREYDLAYNSFLARMREAARADPAPLIMEFPPDNAFGWQVGGSAAQSAEFIEIARVRSMLDDLHLVVLEYLDVLSQLNAPLTPSAERLAASTGKLSGSLQSLAEKLDFEVDPQRLGVFGQAADALGQQLIARKQRAGLTEVMSDFQPVLVTVAEAASVAMATSATGIQTNYQDKVMPIARGIITASADARQALVVQLLELNERTMEQLTLLQELSNTYQRLPAGHLALMEAMQAGGVARLESLVVGITAIADLNDRLQAAGAVEEP